MRCQWVNKCPIWYVCAGAQLHCKSICNRNSSQKFIQKKEMKNVNNKHTKKSKRRWKKSKLIMLHSVDCMRMKYGNKKVPTYLVMLACVCMYVLKRMIFSSFFAAFFSFGINEFVQRVHNAQMSEAKTSLSSKLSFWPIQFTSFAVSFVP